MGGFVSVVVPTRNRAEKLGVCLDSLLAQDFVADDYEIVVVDDGSTDATARAVQDLIDGHSPRAITLVSQRPAGSNAARNAGFNTARGDPVLFVDDDVEAPPTWLSTMAEGFRAYPDAPAFAARVRLRLEHPRRRDCPRHPLAASLDLGERDVRVPSAVGAAIAVRRTTIDRVGPFDPWTTGGDDTEWFDRLAASGGHLMYLGRASVWHRRTASDLGIVRIVRSSFRRGVIAHRYFARTGRTDIARRGVSVSASLLVAALRERCLGALANAALQAGFAYGVVRYRRVQPPDRVTTRHSSR
ncbi:MAG: glycosyltransferase family 2 protein [Acidimicrobiia bacterium]|nr:glycosyltransferase family 2 protein [Acidimicrobiia bacterium]